MGHLKGRIAGLEGVPGVDADGMKRYICQTFDGISVAEGSGDTFCYYDPDGDLAMDRNFPFVTIVTGNHYDSVSALNRPGSYRLNIGLPKATYSSWFGPAPTQRDEHGVLGTGFDYAVRDQVMPHPIYASQYWVCVVNPGAATRDAVRSLLADAHRFAVRKHTNQRTRQSRP